MDDRIAFIVNLVANLIFTPIQFGMRNLPLASIDIVMFGEPFSGAWQLYGLITQMAGAGTDSLPRLGLHRQRTAMDYHHLELGEMTALFEDL